jgi:hypothetical protein
MNLRPLILLPAFAWGSLFASAATDNPYQPIVERNIFNLQPIPTNNPAEQKPPEPPSKILPNGIMTIFGKVQVLFKVQIPPKAGQPAKEQSYVMGEGERQDEIEVRKIDEKNATITFDNHGIVQTLELVKATASSSGVPPVGPAVGAGGGLPRLPAPMAATGAAANTPPAATTIGNRFGRSRTATDAATAGGSGRAGAASAATAAREVNERGIYQPRADSAGDQLTAEQRIILIEAQRAKLLEEGNPTANLLPTTPHTKDIMGEEDVPQ